MSFLIRDKAHLSGTVYVELLPGPYKGQCWGEESIFFAEHHWCLLERIVQRHYSDYNHYGFQTVGKAAWLPILKEFEHLANLIESGASFAAIRSEILFASESSEKEFLSEEAENMQMLMHTLNETSHWVTSVLESGQPVSVLGL